MRSMKAVRIHGYGAADILSCEEVPYPEPNEDDVVIRVHATAVNRVDAAIRAGYMTNWFNLTLPAILGCDVSGTIEEVGSKVTNFKIGDPVYARADVSRNGTSAQFVAVRAAEVAHKPRSLDHIQAAAVPHTALTAWQCLFDAGNLTSGQTVLIHGAAGGVGHFAVQFAKWRGAKVIGTASQRNLDYLRQLGADQVIDYTTTRFEEVVHDVDMVLDSIGGETQQRSWATLKPGGILVSIVQPPSAETAAAHGVRQQMVGAQASAEQLAEIAQIIDAGHIKPTVSTVLLLHEIRQAHTMCEGGHTRGKIVLQVVN